MSLDEQARRFIEASATWPVANVTKYEPAELRILDAQRNPVDMEARALVDNVIDMEIEGPGGPLKIRRYRPRATENPPVVIYLHGGGHGIGSVDVFDQFTCHLCAESHCIVVSVEYRLAPEHKFPADLEDAFAATRWVIGNPEALGTTSKKIGIAGDSAGGALVAGVTLKMREAGMAPADFQALIYPMLAGNAETPSRRRLATGYYVDQVMLDYYIGHYARSEADFDDPLFAPLLNEDLSDLPPALIVTAEYDPLSDEGKEYGYRLRSCGVDVILTEYGGTIHGFAKRPSVFEKGLVCARQVGATMRSALRRGWVGE